MMYYVYILYSVDFDQFYYGQTNNLVRRVDLHNAGFVKATKKYKPWVIFSYKIFDSRAEAYISEKKLKSLKSRKRVSEYISRNNFLVNDLRVIGPENL